MISANYVVDPEFIKKYIPKGTELELFEGKCYVSLVAFLYSNTKLMKVPVPFHRKFEEINLRLYVKRKIGENEWRSEVAFPKLFFPKRAVSIVANTIYKEKYETRRMNHSWSEDSEYLHTRYGIKKGDWHNINVVTNKQAEPIAPNTPEHLFSKHYWGTAQINNEKCTVYEVDRSEWNIYKTVDSDISFDFASVFGSDFHALTNLEPESVQLFDGSPVTVYKKSILR
ncbi:DUF2071 domain-containing protein [Crocinitomicaceae bacterium]|nr:DUF2071 domain-containing protein [Crocinitomicaceae bacterium]